MIMWAVLTVLHTTSTGETRVPQKGAFLFVLRKNLPTFFVWSAPYPTEGHSPMHAVVFPFSQSFKLWHGYAFQEHRFCTEA